MDGRPGDRDPGGIATSEAARGATRRRPLHSTFKPTADRAAEPPHPRGSRVAIGRTLATLAVAYAAAVVAATWPFCRSLADTLPSHGDPSQHLWIMNWYKSCLLQGRSPFFCPDLQYPVGAPLGLFSPLHLQSALFLPLSLVTRNDILSFNIIWMIGLVSTGLGVFVLAWQVTGQRQAAALGGLLAMLSGPVMLHAHVHLELIFVGTIALFLAAWIRFLDRPSWGTLAGASACYVLVGAAAAYYLVLTVVPAAWVVAYRLVQLARREGRAAVLVRVKWLACFVAATLPFAALLMSNQLWAVAHGTVMSRSRDEFTASDMNAPFWGYFVPTFYQSIAWSFLPLDVWSKIDNPPGVILFERASYLGVVTLFLMHQALIHRAKVRGALLWWSLLGIVVVLGMGCYAWLGPVRVSLPALWLWEVFAPFRLLRLSARFHLLAVIPAAVLAALGLGRLLAGLRRPAARGAVLGALAVVAVVDLGHYPYRMTYQLPPMPEGYAWLKRRDPGATLLEWPVLGFGMADRTYWAHSHGLKTSEGYSGVNNMPFLNRIFLPSPLLGMAQADFLADARPAGFGPVQGVAFHDYLWLFLKANGYRYLVVHEDPFRTWNHPVAQARLREQLAGSRVFEDGQMMVFEHARMPLPARPVLACTEGWRSSAGYQAPLRYGVGRVARVAVFNPTPGEALALELDAAACRSPKAVRLMDGPVELARWAVAPGEAASYASPPLHLPAGIRELTIESDAEESALWPGNSLDEARTPYSLRIGAIRVRPAR